MGIYIKGMKMPKDDQKIRFVKLLNGKMYAVKGISYLHEVIEVTEPHGRLIDADKIDAYKLPIEKQESSEWHRHSAAYKYAAPVFNGALDMVKDHAPTVIEAEGERPIR